MLFDIDLNSSQPKTDVKNHFYEVCENTDAMLFFWRIINGCRHTRAIYGTYNRFSYAYRHNLRNDFLTTISYFMFLSNLTWLG